MPLGRTVEVWVRHSRWYTGGSGGARLLTAAPVSFISNEIKCHTLHKLVLLFCLNRNSERHLTIGLSLMLCKILCFDKTYANICFS